jgi:NTE family protein
MTKTRSQYNIGLALSGGGARGLAHIGVLKVLEGAHIPISFISGTSMGSIIGAGYSNGSSPAELEAIALRFSHVRQLIRMVDLAGGRRGLLDGKHVRNFLAEIIGNDTDFSELRIPLSICAVDLNTGKEIIFTEGKVLDAVMASIAVPGIFVPQVVQDHHLVDGGVMNNLPVDHVRALGAAYVIAVDVMHHDFSQFGSGNRSASFSITPTVTFQEVYRYVAMMISEMTRLHLELDAPDILIQPDLPNDLHAFGGFTRATAAISAGEKAAKLALPEINNTIFKSE